jgi:hypothetical protein
MLGLLSAMLYAFTDHLGSILSEIKWKNVTERHELLCRKSWHGWITACVILTKE